MAILPIHIYGSPVLHAVAAPVTKFDDELKTLVANMYETMDAAPGVGIAAPQVGVGLRIFTYNWEEEDGTHHRGVAINPELWISPYPLGEPEEDDEEGCLSFPGERFPVQRAERALMFAVDENGDEYTIRAEGWFARILQHEYDHLNGIIYVDRLQPPWDRAAAKVMKKSGWNVPGLAWTPGVDQIEA